MAFNQALFRVAKTAIIILVSAHILTCLWHYQTVLADTTSLAADGSVIPANWMEALSDTQIDIGPSSIGNRYLVTAYFVVATMMAVGFGDVYPVTTEERILAMFTMLVGAGCFGLIVASVSLMLEAMNARSYALQRRMDEVREYMMDRKLPTLLQRRITKYFRYYYSQSRGSKRA